MRTLLFFALVLSACNGQTKKPDIILVIADDIGIEDVPWNGSLAKMPNLTKLKNAGAELSQFRAFPLCTPSRAALLTGVSPIKFDLLYHPLRPWDKRGLPGAATTIAETLKTANYQTALVGKWHLGHSNPAMHPNRQGFDFFFGFLTGAIDYWSHQSRDGGLDWQKNGNSIIDEEYATRKFGQVATEWIESASSEPLFLCLPLSAPHTPLQAPKETVELVEHITSKPKRVFTAMLQEMDMAIGAVVDSVKKRDRPVLFIFCGDNGPDRNSRPQSLRGAKGSTFDGGLRVPAVLNWAGVIPANVLFKNTVDILDLPATILSAAGIGPPKTIEGRDLVPALKGNKALSPRTHFFAACSPEWITYTAIQHKWKLVIRQKRDEALNKHLLFNLAQDPNETKNLYSKHSDLTTRLKKELESWLKQSPERYSLENPPPRQLPRPKDWLPPKDWAD